MSTLLVFALLSGIVTILATGLAIWQASRVLGAACEELERFEWDAQVARRVLKETSMKELPNYINGCSERESGWTPGTH